MRSEEVKNFKNQTENSLFISLKLFQVITFINNFYIFNSGTALAYALLGNFLFIYKGAYSWRAHKEY